MRTLAILLIAAGTLFVPVALFVFVPEARDFNAGVAAGLGVLGGFAAGTLIALLTRRGGEGLLGAVRQIAKLLEPPPPPGRGGNQHGHA